MRYVLIIDIFYIAFWILLHIPSYSCDYKILPEQVHISFGDKPMSIVVTWVTQNRTLKSVVKYHRDGDWNYTMGTQTMFQDHGSERRVFFVHRVTLSSLMPEKTYFYICGDGYVWSRLLQFKTIPNHADWSVRLAVFGDMGSTNNLALPELIKEVEEHDSFDAILHVGDFAYDMHDDNGRVGDAFMRQIEPIASRVPYMTTSGNHEVTMNFSHYKARFSMPGGDGESQYHSFNIGPVHVIMFSTELYYYLHYGWRQVVNQYDWIKADLEEANRPENRALRPWIMAMGHRPMYCSNSVDAIHCEEVNNLVRTGFPLIHKADSGYILGLEDLFYENGVDLIVGAHEHSYERFWPVYNRTVCNGSTQHPYVNPRAPVHIVTGSAGGKEGKDPFSKKVKPWSAVHSTDYGFTRMHVYNSTHLYVEQVSVDQKEQAENVVVDSFTVIKEKHGAGTYACESGKTDAHVPWLLLQAAKVISPSSDL